MCLHPITISNPNYGRGNSLFGWLKDCTSKYIEVPCGHCAECISLKQMALVQRVQMESLHNHLFFITLTYNDDSLPKLTTSSGYTIRYADLSDVQNMFKRLRKHGVIPRPFRYFAVSELGGKKGRPHFHILLALKKEASDDYLTCLQLEQFLHGAILHEWRRNYGTWRKPEYRPLCTYVRKIVRGKVRSNYDLHYVNRASTDQGYASVAFYVLKYMMKDSTRATRLQQALHLNLDDDEYHEVWSKVKPRYFKSLGFGYAGYEVDDNGKYLPHPLILEHLKKSMAFARDNFEYPVFINPDTDQTFPLARFYKSKGDVFSVDDYVHFGLKTYDKKVEVDLQKHKESLKKLQDYEKKVEQVSCNGVWSCTDWLDEL